MRLLIFLLLFATPLYASSFSVEAIDDENYRITKLKEAKTEKGETVTIQGDSFNINEGDLTRTITEQQSMLVEWEEIQKSISKLKEDK